MSKLKSVIFKFFIVIIYIVIFNSVIYAKSTPTHICKTIEKLDSGVKQHIIVYGTSLTSHGAWVNQLHKILNKRYPDKVKITNSAGAGKNSNWGLIHLKERVLSKNPDTVFIEFAINDSDISLEKSKNNIKKIIQQIKQEHPNCEIILLTMNPFYGKVFEDNYFYINNLGRLMVPKYNECYREIAKEQNILLIDIEKKWISLESNPKLIKKYVPDGLHPTEEACKEVVLPEILKALFNT